MKGMHRCRALRDDPPWPDRGWEEPPWQEIAEREESWAEELDDLDLEPDADAWRELDDDPADEEAEA